MLIFTISGLLKTILIAFSLVTLHEFIHLLAARSKGYKIYKIEIFPFGGMAEYRGLLESEPEHEIFVAAAGPLFNLFFAVFLILMQNYSIIPELEIMELIIKYNIYLGIFNFIPALPLDGGRILRAVLVMRNGFIYGSLKAAKIARIISFMAAIIVFGALFFNKANIWFLLIAFFVYSAALKEEKKFIYTLINYLSSRKEKFMNIDIRPVSNQVVKGNIYLKDLITYIVPGKFNIFHIINENLEIEGSINEFQIIDNFFSIKKSDKQIIELIE